MMADTPHSALRTPHLLDQIPGLREAIERETEKREFDFLDAPELLCGIEVMPLSIRRLLRLQAVQSPFLYKPAATASESGRPRPQQLESPGDVALFLWCLSPNYERAVQIRQWLELLSPALGSMVFNRIRKTFARRLRKLKLVDACTACRQYVAEAFEDSPGISDEHEAPPAASYYAWPANYVGLLSKENWTEAAVVDLPLRRLWQHVRRLMLAKDSKATLFNPSDKVRGRWLLDQLNKN